jgi:hypothetical protein
VAPSTDRPGCRLIIVISLGLMAASLSFSSIPASATTATWSIDPSPNHVAPTYNRLTSVSCVSSNFCMAVGEARNRLLDVPEIQRWDGTSWSLSPTPNRVDDDFIRYSSLSDVSCTSTTFCMAVGYLSYPGRALVEVWDGSSWSIVPGPSRGDLSAVYLSAVSCTKASFCMGVGGSDAASWNGRSWSVFPGPLVRSTLMDVSCTKASFCMAVGLVGTYRPSGSTGYKAVVGRWNGSYWTRLRSPHTGSAYAELDGVSCTATDFCVAVGSFSPDPSSSQTLIESWYGTGLAIVPSPNTATGGGLRAVSCVSSSSCTAVGSSEGDQALVESWNGSDWSIVQTPEIGAVGNSLQAVSCVSTASCTAVSLSLIAAWDGSSWAVVPSPDLRLPSTNVLNGVTCASTSSCIAVGSFAPSGEVRAHTLVQSWDGTKWSKVSSPNAGFLVNTLNGISCVSASDCMAVGYFDTTGHQAFGTLAESWDGSSWSIVPTPNPDHSDSLEAVSCTSSTFCMAVGYRKSGSVPYYDQSLVESWNGTSWSVVPSPTAPARSHLSGVSCTSSRACMAVGVGADGVTLTESWDGSSWSVVPSPNTASGHSSLSGVSCTSSRACMAVGGGAEGVTLTESWDGSAWSVVPSPSLASGYSLLSGVSCTSSRACVAVGGEVQGVALTESWNGSSWSGVPSPNAARYSSLSGVSCTSSIACTAVGFRLARWPVMQTLIESST